MRFETVALSALTRHGHKQRTPHELLGKWASFIKECAEGYDWTIYEFDDEISVRDHIEAILTEPRARECDGFENFRSQVEQLDAKYRSLLQDGVKRPAREEYWWRTGVLRYAGAEYCEDMFSQYAIRVERYRDE